VPGYPWTPAFFVLAAAYVVASSIGANPKNAAIGTGLILLGVPVFLFWRTRRSAVSAS
jgi:APA family basic amino acid/polyamine antiporter